VNSIIKNEENISIQKSALMKIEEIDIAKTLFIGILFLAGILVITAIS